MSGLFGAKGPSPLSMLRGELREKRKKKEQPGHSNTKRLPDTVNGQPAGRRG